MNIVSRILPAALMVLVVAPVAALGTFSIATTHQNPVVALQAWSGNGFADQQIANALYVAATVKNPTAALESHVTPRQRELALKAYIREPLSPEAVSILGLGEVRYGKEELAAKLLDKSGELSRRNQIARSWLIAKASQRGDLKTVLENIDISLRIRPASAPAAAQVLAQAMAQPGSVPSFVSFFRTNPSWEDAVWQAANSNPKAVANAVRVRMQLQRTGEDALAIDRELLTSLIRLREFELADAFVRSRYGSQKALLRNGDFAAEPLLPPFDWELETQGDYGAFVDTKSGTLAISALPGAQGIVARQLVVLKPGRYTMTARYARGAQSGNLRLMLSCALPNINRSLAISPEQISDSQRFEVGADCPYFWASIELLGRATGSGFDTSLDSFEITPAS
tara:strand:+ start:5239 stop:6429 length:1191 start_codon:yes stop_codon:yes gene_type:complete